jgi:hypothetical protein
VLTLAGRPAAALTEVEKVLSSYPDYEWGRALRVWTLVEAGRTEEVEDGWRSFRRATTSWCSWSGPWPATPSGTKARSVG